MASATAHCSYCSQKISSGKIQTIEASNCGRCGKPNPEGKFYLYGYQCDDCDYAEAKGRRQKTRAKETSRVRVFLSCAFVAVMGIGFAAKSGLI
jgi:hypothetical protein